MSNKAKFIHVICIRTPAEKLWDALIKPELTKQYCVGTWQVTDWVPRGAL